jgi:hypothetical protein
MQPEWQDKVDELLETMVIVHEGHTPDLLANNWMASTKLLKPREENFAGEKPLEAFAKVNKEFGQPLQRFAQKRTGFQADFYLPNNN